MNICQQFSVKSAARGKVIHYPRKLSKTLTAWANVSSMYSPISFYFFCFFLVQLQKIPGWTGGISNSSVALLSRAEMFWGVRFGRQWAALMHVKWSAQDSLLHLLLLSHRRRGQGRGRGRMPPLFSAASSDASTSRRQNENKSVILRCHVSICQF